MLRTVQLIAPTPFPLYVADRFQLPQLTLIALAIALASMPQLIVHCLMDVHHASSCLGFRIPNVVLPVTIK